ncbi:MAG: hypothetical protein IT456_21320, partial [Planctomycetes bacterium]|nr:hypothetical protein [Planctomycetota bacterium]
EGGASTLMPIGRLIRHFRHVIDTGYDVTLATQVTYPLTFDRGRAQRERVALARIGDPFIDALSEYVNWDDRGVVAAMWRYRPTARYSKPAEVAFHFEFVVECPTEEAVEVLPVGVLGAASAIGRQADWLFPPFTISVWLDQDLEPVVAESSKAIVLEEGYSNKLGIDGGRDFNLNSERWAALDATFPRSDWSRWVERARATAEEVVRVTPGWLSSIADRLETARRAEVDRAAQAASRLAFLTGAHKEQEAVRAAVDAAVVAALLRGVEDPSLRLDSVSAVFLANWHPFSDVDE